MDGEAREVRFQNLIDEGLLLVNDGYRAKHSELGIGGPIFLRAVHLQDAGFDFAGVQYFQDHVRERVISKMAMCGDTVVTTKGNSTGRTGYVSESMPPFVYSPHLSFWRTLDHSKLKPLFLRYWARGPEFQDQLSGLKESTDMAPYLSLTDQRRLRITLPPPRTQEAIGNLLGALDDKIEANRALNETLEATCQALFRSWFVDFDPVVAKSEGRKPPRLTDDVAALFPDSFEDSPIGPVPTGWRAGTVVDIAELVREGVQPKDSPLEAFLHFSIPAFDTGKVPAEELGTQIQSNKFLVPEGAVLLAKLNPHIPRVWFPDDERERRAVASTEFLVMVPRAAMERCYLYGLFSSSAFMVEFSSLVTGTSNSHQRVKPDDFLRMPVVVPDDEVVRASSRLFRPMIETQLANLKEAQTLAVLRDALLPRLLSGELRVRRAEQLVEGAI